MTPTHYVLIGAALVVLQAMTVNFVLDWIKDRFGMRVAVVAAVSLILAALIALLFVPGVPT